MDSPEEIRETLFRTLDKLDELYGDRSSYEEVRRVSYYSDAKI